MIFEYCVPEKKIIENIQMYILYFKPFIHIKIVWFFSQIITIFKMLKILYLKKN
jgi:hypothetical protein